MWQPVFGEFLNATWDIVVILFYRCTVHFDNVKTFFLPTNAPLLNK
jgi:hypothetical protein